MQHPRDIGDLSGYPSRNRSDAGPTEHRVGYLDVLVPDTIHPSDLRAYIRHRVRAELAESSEWPVQVEFRSGPPVNGSAGVRRWEVTYETGTCGEEI